MVSIDRQNKTNYSSSFGSTGRNNVVFVLGAGFSHCADLPVQEEFSSLLISEQFNTEIDGVITKAIKMFLKQVFGWKQVNDMPSLEDIFTIIDLTASSGHHLMVNYTPKRLRALRRMLIYRIFQAIDLRFNPSEDIDKLLRIHENQDCSFVVMNWDIVLEKHLRQIDNQAKIDYMTPSYDWNNYTGLQSDGGTRICKMHGSSNWVYCENCKSLFYHLDEKLSLHKKVGLIKSDFRLFDNKFRGKLFDESLGINPDDKKCKICTNSVASHIATFSYRKSFRTAAYPAIWSSAENLLANSTKWVFIGYSLPEADFEFKHLIKSAQLRLRPIRVKRDIDVVINSNPDTKRKFEKFFGVDNVNIIKGGLSAYVSSF